VNPVPIFVENDSMRETFLRHMGKIFSRHYRAVFTGAILITAALVVYFVFRPPRIDSDILDLLPQNNPVVHNFRSITRDFKSLDYLFVLIQTKNPAKHPIQGYEDYADIFAEQLKTTGMVEGVEYRLQDYMPLVDRLLPYTLLYLNKKDLNEVAAKFSDKGISRQVALDRLMLENPASLLIKEKIQYDPFNLFPVLQRHFLGKTRELKVDLSDGYYLSRAPHPQALLMIVRPVKPAQNIQFGKALMNKVAACETRARAEWKREGGNTSDLVVRYGGGYPIAQDDANLIKRDSLINTITSILLVMIIFVAAFRRKSALAYCWIPLMFGLLMTFGIAHLLGVTLNSVTAGSGAMLIGLGIDFSIVLYGRYIEERNRGVGVDESISSIMGNTGKGVAVGALTTAGTYGVMYFTHFPGMRQIGALTAVGIMFCLLGVFTLLPAMLYFHHVHKTRRGIDPTFHMHSFGVEKLGRAAYRFPRTTLAVALILTIILGVSATGLKLEDSVQNLRSPNNRGLKVTQDVYQIFGASLTYMMVAVSGKTPDDIVRKSQAVVNAVAPLHKKHDILFTDAVNTYLPPLSQQREVIRTLREDPEGRFSFQRIKTAFDAACEKQGFRTSYFSHYLGKLQEMVSPSGPVTYHMLEDSPLKAILDKFIVQKGPDHYRGVVYLYIPEAFKRWPPPGLISMVHEAVPGAKVVGINMLSRTLRTKIQSDALFAFVLGTILVVILILVDFRSIKAVLFALLPLAVGLIWLLGCLRLFDEPLNMMNIFVTTMIIGIGSDYGIHFVHRHMEKDGHDMPRVIQESGKPIVIAALTTIAGFGSMVFSSYPGLKSVGYVALLGTLSCMVATLTVLVALMTLLDRRKDRAQS
jgi:uncharacterized protein